MIELTGQLSSLSTIPVLSSVIIISQVSRWSGDYFDNVLCERERTRQQSFRNQVDQRRYAVAHGLKRHILSQYMNMPPEALLFSCNSYGKPYCSQSNAVYFNISHSDDWVVLGVSLDSEVGVDVEFSRNVNELAVMQRIATPLQIDTYKNSDDKSLSFLCFWTQKEAVSKLSGRGLAVGLSNIQSSGQLGAEPIQFMSKTGFLYSFPHSYGVISYASWSKVMPKCFIV